MAASDKVSPVAVLLGSKSDLDYGRETVSTLDKLGISADLRIMSAHRTPEAAREFAKGAADNGTKVIIALAGSAAHLPGVLASYTQLPIIGVPLPTSDLQGVDSLHAIVQMPGGIPVASMAIGTAGARNAGLFAAQILALNDDAIAEALRNYRAALAQRVISDSAEVSKP